MGGINCPPGGNRRAPSTLVDEYINKLAHYCESLFSGASTFWSANADVERTILTGQPLDEAVCTLAECEKHMELAQSNLGSVGALWGTINPTQQHDFESQIIAIGDSIRAIAAVRMELSVLSEGPSLQDRLWEETVSNTFRVAAEGVHDILAWQTHFAAQSHIMV